jgi:hypothetical protein
LDHGTVIYDNTTPSPFPTRLHVWLLALGIPVRFTRKCCPTDHAIIERTRPSDDGSSAARTNYSSHTDLWAGLDERRKVLNHHLPSRALSHKPPIARHSRGQSLGTILPHLHGKRSSSLWRRCARTSPRADGSAAFARMGSLVEVAINTTSGSTLREPRVALHFDPEAIA